jgi:two-component system, OmpR family, phosphate regulon sensor histidine kinase PhoR
MAVEAARGLALVEESREIVVVLDDDGTVLAASRRARQAIPELHVGESLPPSARLGRRPLEVPYQVLDRGETLLYLSEPAENAAYEELRAGFTAAVSHELRTPLARIMTLLETATLPREDPQPLIEQARREVEQIGELIDDVLFLSELESDRQIVALSSTPLGGVVDEVVDDLAQSADRAGVTLRSEIAPGTELPLRPRMLRVVIENLVANSIRYAGPHTTCIISAGRDDGEVVLTVADNGGGVDATDLPRLFERFYRADRARASRGTGLGLAIVKHVVTAAGGAVEAEANDGSGLVIRCRFPVP